MQIFKVTVCFIIEKTQNCSRTFIGRVSYWTQKLRAKGFFSLLKYKNVFILYVQR